MTAIEIVKPGGPEVLEPTTRPVPTAQAGEVLIRVRAAGVNRPDVLQRQGGYAPPPGASDIPGLEVAGEIVATAGDVLGLTVGDRVMALVAGGGYAEYCVAPAGQCLPIPGGVSVIEAGGIPETFFTVWTNVFDRAALGHGESFLVHGGASGIGTTAIQLARAAGARVFATAGTGEKCRACMALGAEQAVNYREADFEQSIREATQGAGVDVILDMVGGDYTARNLALLREEGRLVQIAFLKGSKVQVDLNAVMRKRLTLTGSTLRPRTVAQKSAIADKLRSRVLPWLEAGKVRSVVHATYPLRAAAAAHAALEADRHVGKIVLELG
ncbi:MAG: NAD(P)H-quinone oxidoreductase [Alphaproteobacteria bacterium]|nr:NAD(P)H-quinone oxidoreductase [Alphaproteobacteria bacterium]